MDLKITDNVFLVTAASQGLGFAVAETLAAEGAKVIICSRNETSLKEAVAQLGSNAQYFVADVSKTDDVKRLMREVAGVTSKLDGVFVNAGGPPPGQFKDISDEQWAKAFELTLMSAVRLTRESLPLLRKSDMASILYSTSISVKQPIDNLLLSNALRPGVIGMMRTLSDEIASDGVRVNAICPGYIRTARVEELLAKSPDPSGEEKIATRIPLGRIGSPAEFGAVCAFLMSPLASYVHGSLLLVDGGLYRGMM